jgi:uncharacterized LabA/DUF88 family protein
MRTNVYIDGFNLYYGALRGTRHRWLDVAKLCSLALPDHAISRIRYFTARVSARANNPAEPLRQQVYLRALGTIPSLSIHFGHFLTHEVTMPRVVSPGAAQEWVRVYKTEEKGSDVNIATYLLRDGFRDEYDVAVLITNDSDLLEPIRIVHEELGKRVGLLNPQRQASRALSKEAFFIKDINRPGILAASQFQPRLRDDRGEFTKPDTW